MTWLLRRLGETWIVQHDGGVPGYVSTLVLVPARQFAIVLVANAEVAFLWLSEVTYPGSFCIPVRARRWLRDRPTVMEQTVALALWPGLSGGGGGW